jgi:hypothetical protein
MVLFGHRSIVNQVRYNYQKCLIASSGVEKIIKVRSIAFTSPSLLNSTILSPDLVSIRRGQLVGQFGGGVTRTGESP